MCPQHAAIHYSNMHTAPLVSSFDAKADHLALHKRFSSVYDNACTCHQMFSVHGQSTQTQSESPGKQMSIERQSRQSGPPLALIVGGARLKLF